jgi:hypothetical protein
MTQLESILSQLYEIVQTAYTATAGEDAVPTAVHVLAHDYKYQIYVSWTALSILAMTAACIVLCRTLLQTVAWAGAKLLEEKDHQTHNLAWNLLQPVDLMHYSALASDDLKSHFLTSESGSLEIVEPDSIRLGPRGVVLSRVATRQQDSKTSTAQYEDSALLPEEESETRHARET